MIYFSYSLDLLPLVHQLSVVTYTHMWYDKNDPFTDLFLFVFGFGFTITKTSMKNTGGGTIA